MRLALRIIGFVLAAGAVILFAGDVIAGWQAGGLTLRPIGQIWRTLDVASLNGLQVGIERYVWPPLWSSVVFPILLVPASLACAVLALIFLWFGRSRRSARKIFGRR